MSVFIKQILFATLIFVLFAVTLLIPTFLINPFESWSELWEREIFDFPYIYSILIFTILVGLVVGAISGWYWRQKLKWVHEQLEAVTKGEKRERTEYESLKELKELDQQFLLLEKKFADQTKLAQQLATERATEREKSLQEVVVQERNRLARELHDSVSQQLFAASMMMSTVNETNPPAGEAIKKQLHMVEKMIEQSQLEMRALLLHLRPAALKGKTLTEGIEELLAELKQKVSIEIEQKLEPLDLDKGVEDQLFRILQESVSNTLRHAKANRMQVMLIERDGHIILRVADDGGGFDVEETKNNGSYGLENMKERAESIGGSIKVVSVLTEGSRLEVKIPKIGNEVDPDD